MPYTPKGHRKLSDGVRKAFKKYITLNKIGKGDFNQLVTSMFCILVEEYGLVSYTNLTNWNSVFIDISGEVKRRFIDYYEDLAKELNADLPEMERVVNLINHKFKKP